MTVTELMATRMATITDGRRHRGAPVPPWAEAKAVALAVQWAEVAAEQGVQLADLDQATDLATSALDAVLATWWRITSRRAR